MILAKFALVVACASTVDAFRPVSLGSFAPALRTSHEVAQLPGLGLRKHVAKSHSLLGLRGSVNPLTEALEKVYNDPSVPHSREAMYAVAQTNFVAWNEALKARDYDRAASMYSSTDLTFLPTVSPEFIRDSHGTRSYFKDFVLRLPAGQITSDAVQSFSSDIYLHTGMYTFMTGPEDNRQPVQARFSYMWRLINGQWKIIHHHSSEVPGKNVKTPVQQDLYPVAQANFNTWNDALKAKDYEKVAALYSTAELSFLPTVSPKFIRDSQSTKEYFMDFLKKLPEGTITEDNVQPYGNDAYLHTGMYTFQTGPENNRQPVQARFSYMWRQIDGAWKIVHHHSSALPRVPGTEVEENKAEDFYPIAQANFEAWNDALKAKDYEKVAALYSSTDLSFLPTVSPKFIQDKQSTKEYFVDFLKKLPEGTITADNVQPYGSDAYLHTGMYTFQTGPEGNRQPVQARFSYMWRKIDGAWKIVHHHSSALPRVPGTEPEELKAEDMYPIAQANFKSWNDALKEKDYKKVAALYSSKELSFLPTVSPQFIQDGASTEQYFVEFLKKLPEGTITQDNVQSFGPDAYLHTGMYTFMTGPESARAPVEARFSYMWRKIDGVWKIVHHHSSALPRVPGTQAEESKAEDYYPIAQANFKAWNDALKGKDYKKVAALYSSKDLSFLPTVSPKFIRDSASAEQYFIDFLKKLPDGVITQDNVQSYGPDSYLHSGLYTFMTGAENNRQPVEARFSYMWRKIDGVWKIVHHHSSALPRVAGTEAEEIKSEDMYPIAQANFKAWNDALKAKDYEKVAAIYSSQELSFLPTVSPKFIRDPESTKQYFVEFLKKLPEGTITQDNVQSFGPDSYLHTGMYTFMTGPDYNRQPVEARFSYMWRKIGETWKIVHHHSSALPRVPGTQEEEIKAEDMYPIAQANFKAWNDALKEKCYEKVADLYSSKELSFLPTVSPKFIQDTESTKQYFVDFLKKLPEGTITADNVQSYGNDAYLHTGMYTFQTGPEGNRQPVQARFSYMWRKIDGAWKIVHHHSSALPSGGAPPPAEAESFTVTTGDDDKTLVPAAAEKETSGPFSFLANLFK